MDHIVYLDSGSKEIESLLDGKKSMIIRGSSGIKPYTHVDVGDILYFINNDGGNEIRARGVVSSVFCSGTLSVEESFATIIRNQDKLQLPDNQFEKIAGKSYLILVELKNIEGLAPIKFERKSFTFMDDWLPVGKIEEFILSDRGIISV
jgi:hypothetical protein